MLLIFARWQCRMNLTQLVQLLLTKDIFKGKVYIDPLQLLVKLQCQNKNHSIDLIQKHVLINFIYPCSL